MSVKMKFGSKDIPFVYKGNKLVYPNPIKDGLLLWYDFKGMRSTDTNKEVAKDLSLNGNDGTLTNFNFTEGSGYKENTLVFDGVDDSLTIPELELDETAMTVVHDGKIYSYEDDKVIKVKKYSEGLEVGGRNYLQNSDFSKGLDEYWTRMNSSPQENFRVEDGLLTVISNPDSNSDFGITNFLQKNHLEGQEYIAISSSMKGTGSLTVRFGGINMPTKSIDNDDFKRVVFVIPKSNFGNGNLIIDISSGELTFNRIKAETGNIATDWTPAPEDFQTTSFSPSSLSNLQLYNRPLRKDELLHNAESKGLKKLKPGVIVQDGLVLHYDFSYESNTSEYKDKAFDYSGNGNHGTLQNFGYAEGSGYDEGLTFDGVDDAIQSIGLWEDTGKVTIEAVIKKLPTGNNGTVIGATNRNFELLLFRDATVVAYYSDGTNANYRQHQFTLYELTEKINYLAVVFHKDLDKVELYANGVLKAQRTDSANRDLTGFEPSDTIKLGHRNSTNRLQGELYSTRIYKKALTPEEIAHNYEIEKEKFNII